MKTSPPDDRQELEELRRLLRSDGLRIPEGLRSEQIVQKLREGASPTSVSRRNLLRPLLVTAAAAVVVCLLILPVWENMSQSTDLLLPQHTAAPEQTADAQNAAGSTTSPDNGTAGTTDEHTLLGTSGKGGGNLTLDGTSGTTSTVEIYGKPAGQPDSLPAATAPETVPSMSYDNAKPYFESGALLIDLRPEEAYLENHADEAIYMPFSSLGDALPKMADTGQTVFFLPPDAQSGAAVAEILRGLGYTRIYELTGI